MHNIERVPIPFHTINVDHLGPFPDSAKKNSHVLVITDNFTKYTFLKAVKGAKCEGTVKVMQEFMDTFGCPSRIITDRGTAFTGKNFVNFCADNDIKHVLNATACPRANGQVERQNRVLKAAISTMTDNDKYWDTKIKQIQFGINSMRNKTTRKSPHELLFSYHPRNILQNKIVLALESENADQDYNLEELRTEALARIQEGQRKQKTRFDATHKKPKRYKEGDLVLIKREATAMSQPKKLAPIFKGPYVIKTVLPSDRYALVDIPGAPRTQRSFNSIFSSDNMKPWCTLPESDVEEEDDDDDQDDVADNQEDVTDNQEDVTDDEDDVTEHELVNRPMTRQTIISKTVSGSPFDMSDRAEDVSIGSLAD